MGGGTCMDNKVFPGHEWLDTDGNRIEAHGGTMYFEDNVYYWIGEDKSHTRKKGKLWTWGIRIYSSRDLINWKYEKHIIEPEPNNKKSIFHPNRRLDRPHLIKNPKTGKYVLWVKYCDTDHYAVLTSDNLMGPYEVIHPFLQPYGNRVGDFDLALDDSTNTAYIYFESNHEQLLVAKLNDSFTDVIDEYAVVYETRKPPLTREAPAHFMHNGKHYLITSGMTGYVPNPSEIAVSDDWMGPFTVLGDPCTNDDSSATFNSQCSHVFQIRGTDKLIMMADRWVPDFVVTKDVYESLYRVIYSRVDKSLKPKMKDIRLLMSAPLMGKADTSKGNYVWLPFSWKGQMPTLAWQDVWDPRQ